jgi:hypothetical protein
LLGELALVLADLGDRLALEVTPTRILRRQVL